MEFLVVENLRLEAPPEGRGSAPDPLVDDLGFVLEKRRSLSLVGEDRRALLALALAVVKAGPVAAGSITFAGIPLLSFSEARFRPVRRRLQAVFPDALGQLPPGLTVREAFREVLDVWARREGKEERGRRVEAAMIACGLPEAIQDLYPAELDAVERQCVALARAMLPGPELLVCCGLTEGLDDVQTAELLPRVRHLREEFDLTLLVLTDDLAVASLLGETVGVMHRGRLVESGPAGELVRQPSHEYTRRLVAAAL